MYVCVCVNAYSYIGDTRVLESARNSQRLQELPQDTLTTTISLSRPHSLSVLLFSLSLSLHTGFLSRTMCVRSCHWYIHTLEHPSKYSGIGFHEPSRRSNPAKRYGPQNCLGGGCVCGPRELLSPAVLAFELRRGRNIDGALHPLDAVVGGAQGGKLYKVTSRGAQGTCSVS